MRWDLPLATRQPGDKFSSQQLSLVFTTDNPWMPLRACETQKRLYFYLSHETKMISVIPLISDITPLVRQKSLNCAAKGAFDSSACGSPAATLAGGPPVSHAVKQLQLCSHRQQASACLARFMSPWTGHPETVLGVLSGMLGSDVRDRHSPDSGSNLGAGLALGISKCLVLAASPGSPC